MRQARVLLTGQVGPTSVNDHEPIAELRDELAQILGLVISGHCGRASSQLQHPLRLFIDRTIHHASVEHGDTR